MKKIPNNPQFFIKQSSKHQFKKMFKDGSDNFDYIS